jgi:hypothetical protein
MLAAALGDELLAIGRDLASCAAEMEAALHLEELIPMRSVSSEQTITNTLP